jgi:aminoglycoside phosphotransferase (APT) family kinase protein
MVRDVSGTRSSEEFRLDLHASFGVPPDEVAAVVRKATGRPMVSLSRVVRGQECEVYRAVADSDVEVVIRIKRFGEEGTLADEAWAMDQARRAGVPVPEVLLVDHLTGEDADLPVMVLAIAEGEALTDRAGLTAAERHSALARAGEVLARINGVTVPGFWRPGPDGEWTKDWVALMTGFIADREAERDLVCGMGFGAAEFDRMIALLRAYTAEFPCRRPVLCHGDFTSEHIFVDGRLRVSAIIDFGMWCGGPPISDLAYLRYAMPRADLAAILAGYGATANDDDAFGRRLDLHALGLAIGNLASDVTIDNTAAARESADSLAAILRSLSG